MVNEPSFKVGRRYRESHDDILLTQAAYASLEEIDAYSFQELRESVSGVDLKFYSVGWRA